MATGQGFPLHPVVRSWRRLLAGASALPGADERETLALRRRRRLPNLPRNPGLFAAEDSLATEPLRAFDPFPGVSNPTLGWARRALALNRCSAGEISPVAAAATLGPAQTLLSAGERLLRRGWNPLLGNPSLRPQPQPAFAAGQSASRRSRRVAVALRRRRRRLALRQRAGEFSRDVHRQGFRRLRRRRSVRATLRELAERQRRRRKPGADSDGTFAEEVTPQRSRDLYQLLCRRLRRARRRWLRRRSGKTLAEALELQPQPEAPGRSFSALATLRRRSAALAAEALVALPPTAPEEPFAQLRGALLASAADGLTSDAGRLAGLSPRGRWHIHGYHRYWELDDDATAPFRREFAYLEEGARGRSPGMLTFLPRESNGSSLGLGQLPRSHSLWLFHSKLFWYYLAVILSPRRNNVRCTVQPQGGPLAVRNRRRLVHLSAGLLPGHRRGRQRRSLETRRELYRRAAFRLLRFAKYRSHYRFLLFKTPHLLAGLADRRSPGGLYWDLRQIFGPFVERRLYKLLPPAEAWSVRSTPPHFGASRLGQPRRSRKHPPRLKRISF